MVLRFFLFCSIFFLVYCSEVEFNNPDDPRSPSYRGNVSSSSGGSGESSSSALVSSSSTAMVPSSSSVTPSSSSSSVAQSSSTAKVSSSSVATVPSSSSISTQSGIILGPSVPYEGETYQTVVIGTQTWFKRNLNYAAEGSKCYENQESNCATYGRLYNWATAMNLPANCNSSICSSQIKSKHQGICPSGWHIPSDADWDVLMTAVGGSSTAGRKLKATSGWDNCGPSGSGSRYVCEDAYGFSALPGGGGYSVGSFNDVGYYGHWWSASEYNSYNAYRRYMDYDSEGVYYNDGGKYYLRSVRCLQD